MFLFGFKAYLFSLSLFWRGASRFPLGRIQICVPWNSFRWLDFLLRSKNHGILDFKETLGIIWYNLSPKVGDVLTAASLAGGNVAWLAYLQGQRTHHLKRNPFPLLDSFHCYSRPPPTDPSSAVLSNVRCHSPSGIRKHLLILSSPPG